MPSPFTVAWLEAAVSLGHYIFMTLCCLREEQKIYFCLAVLPLTSDTAYSSPPPCSCALLLCFSEVQCSCIAA